MTVHRRRDIRDRRVAHDAQQPEPAAFCSPLELDGDPPPSRLSVRGVLLTVAVVLTVCVAWSWLVAS